jgi:chromosome segregation ATPase
MTDELMDRIEQLERELSISRMAQVVMDNGAEELTAERDKYEAAWMTAEGKLADADAMIEAQAKDHASNNIRFAEATHRIEALTESRDALRLIASNKAQALILANEETARLREALERIAGVKGPYGYPFPESDQGYGSFTIVTAREALKGESRD